MGVLVWLHCDHLVPYGVCGNRTYSLADTVAAAIADAERDGWHAHPGENGNWRLWCPGHAGHDRRAPR